jgi:molecular chaperone HtpG
VTESPHLDQGGGAGDGKTETIITEKVLNSIKPIWEKSKKDVSREEYVSFYRQQFHDWNEPAEIIHCQGEGTIGFSALLFIPSILPQGLYTDGSPAGLNLYCKHVLVMKNCQDLLPNYLRFVRGVVDSPDLSLNISREVLQHNRQLESVRNYIEKKIIESLRSILSKDREKYERLWAEFGKVLKGGIFLDHRNTEKLQDLLVFDSSRSVDKKATLREYVERMPESQEAIYYVTGEDRLMVERLPQMEVFLDSGIEVLYFLDKVDEFLTEHLREYEGRKLQSVSRGELNLQHEQKPEDKEGQSEDQYKDLLEFVRNSLGQKVRDVRLSKRLKSSPVCLVSGDTGLSLNMERLMREANQPMFRASRILEINPDHEVIKSIHCLLKKGRDETKLSGLCQLLYDQALIIENEKIEDPIKFSQTVSQLIVDSCDSHQ